jgi:CubicO group peptidase (beta-lactamase class C family)
LIFGGEAISFSSGKIELDAPTQTYLPWFRVADVEAPQMITVRQLLNQTSGLPQSVGQTQFASTEVNDAAIENNVRALANIELIAVPGEGHEYSNANYTTLGIIVQEVGRQSYETYIAVEGDSQAREVCE